MVCSNIPHDQLASKFGFYLAYARTGELPRAIIRMKAKGVDVSLFGNTGFTLPANIGELGDEITELNLNDCSLTGAVCSIIPHNNLTSKFGFCCREHSCRARPVGQLDSAQPRCQSAHRCTVVCSIIPHHKLASKFGFCCREHPCRARAVGQFETALA